MNSIRYKIFFSTLVFLIIPFILTFNWMNKKLENVIEQKIGSAAQDSLYLVNFNIELFLEDMLQSSLSIATNPTITKLLKEPEAFSPYEKLRLNDAVLNRLHSSYFTNTDVTLFDRKGNWLSTSYLTENLLQEYIGATWYRQMMSKPYQQKWFFNHKERLYLDRKPIITLVKTITELQSSQNIGMVAFSVNETDIRGYLKGLKGEVYLVDQAGTVVSSPTKAMVGQSLSKESYMHSVSAGRNGQEIIEKNGRKWIVNYDTVQMNGWKIVQVVPYDTVFKEIYDIRHTNIILFILILIVFLLITMSIAYGISKPLKLLRKRMRELEDKGFHSTLSVSGPQEIASLIETYNKMVKEIRGLLIRVKEEYEQKEDMRFRALQAQINPHFILNTLNNIKWMAYIRNDGEVGDMLSNLGGILEGSVGRGSSLIPLRQELSYIENYVGLMKMKFPDLTLEFDIAEEWMEQEVIQIMLQPIIENSLMHGIEPSNEAGRIMLQAQGDSGQFMLEVRDNGVGMDEERLKLIRERLAADATAAPPERIGIKNVHDRIRLQYGDDFGIRIESMKDNGTRVQCILPLKRREG
ncbi:integral membrane sensor signal transduction histidine kinase [Paenibacillus curdlanolyticus YK9]|uniref:Integral membrane sensor signal transduction histidine kinase n=1 Tax=Paenibacillus curdlanolyticus YK9 TaxID=717606 RepID=E0IEZ4_9BACL|nr:sensor histidine kinase [Paenibacillus curdlanolyticus]EFM08770.1 integral membrane sensor signal transduction histidine kinase [Paenibacillus curdlanolyticus YK9]